jgi:lipopolysaccharide transport system ATP-binding protein
LKPIVRVEGLGKQYRIAVRRASDNTPPEPALSSPRSINLSKQNGLRFETIWALKDVRFDVEPGEALGIVGRNGAGKSTLLKILSRITRPTTGRVRLYGRVGSLLEVGTGFHPDLTGRENVYLNGAILGMKRSEIDRKFDAIVAFSEIEKFIDTPVKWYSSGMGTRLAFAVAANFEPEVLIVDEVLAVGDAEFQKKCLAKMGEISSAGRTVIFVSHNMTAIETLCNRVLWLEDGEVVEKEKTERVVFDYVHTENTVVTEKVWDDPSTAPGNDKIKLHSAKVYPLSQQNSDEIDVVSPIELEFEFWNYQSMATLNFTVHLFTVYGVHVFSAASGFSRRRRGLVRETIQVPADFLNEGIYTVMVQAGQGGPSPLHREPEVLVFEVVDRGSHYWTGKWPGVTRPRLEWISQDIGEDHALPQ